VLDDLAVAAEAEDVDSGLVVIAGPLLEAVEHDQVAVGDCAHELDRLAGVLGLHPLEVLDESVFAVAHVWDVLDVLGSRVAFDGSRGRDWLNMRS